MTNLLFLPFLLAAFARPVEIDVRPGPMDTFSATLVGPAGGSPAGVFTGRLALNGSAVELPISARAEASRDRLRLPLTLRYTDIPQDWANRFRPETFDYRLQGRVPRGPAFEWAGTARWDAIGLEGERETARRFLRLRTLEVTDVSLFSSEARALVSVRNPFAFPLTLAATRYRLAASDRVVGSGQTRGMMLRARQESTLILPVQVEHGELVAAAGKVILSGGDLPARLSGTLTVRLPRGDVAVPLDLSGQLSILP